jgi:hypothetical protein
MARRDDAGRSAHPSSATDCTRPASDRLHDPALRNVAAAARLFAVQRNLISAEVEIVAALKMGLVKRACREKFSM